MKISYLLNENILLIALTLSVISKGNSQNYIYTSESYTNKIYITDLNDFTSKRDLIAGQEFVAIIPNQDTSKLFIADVGKKALWTYDLTNKKFNLLIDKLELPKDIYYSAKMNKIFAIDNKRIISIELENLKISNIISNLDNPSSIIIDEKNEKIYYSEFGLGTINIANLDGTSKKIIIKDIFKPDHLAIDNDGSIYYKIYCGGSACNGIQKAKLDGTQVKHIVKESIGPMYLDIENKRIFYTITWTSNNIFYCDLDGKNEKKYSSASTVATDLIFIKKENKVYCTNLLYAFTLISCRQNLDYFESYSISDVFNPTTIRFDTINKKILWINTKSVNFNDRNYGIMRANYDGSNIEKIGPKGSDFGYIHFGLDIDPINKKIYWIESSEKQFLSANLDGSNIKILPVKDLVSPSQLVVNTNNNKLLWADSGKKSISQCNFDGTNVEVLVDSKVAGKPTSLTFDKKNNRIFWYEFDKDSIFMANANGLNAKAICKSGFTRIINLAFNEYDQSLYWSDYFSPSINSCKIDNPELVNVPLKSDNTFARIYSLVFTNIQPTKTIEINTIQKKITYYPTLVTDMIYIQSLEKIPAILYIHNFIGELKSKTEISNLNNSISTSDLTPGIYVAKIIWQDKTEESFKFVKI